MVDIQEEAFGIADGDVDPGQDLADLIGENEHKSQPCRSSIRRLGQYRIYFPFLAQVLAKATATTEKMATQDKKIAAAKSAFLI